jgi:hypothetical protein
MGKSLFEEFKSNWKSVLIIFILFALIEGGILYLSTREEKVNPMTYPLYIKGPEYSDVSQFRNLVINFVRKTAENYFNKQPMEYPEKLRIEGNWEIRLTIYHQGEIKGESQGKNEILSSALEEATTIALEDKRAKGLVKEDLKDVRFLVSFLSPPERFSFIEYKEETRETVDGLVLVRGIDKELILEKIRQGKEFLYRMANEEKQGFYKKYDVLNDSFENRLYTPYSASIIYTFLYIYDLEKDKEILEHIPAWGDFLLSMQNKNKEDKGYGAFSYSFFLDSNEKEKKFVVGTSALSIFTLLRLYDLTGDLKYLESAKLAGDWLATMQNPDGSMKAYLEYSNGKWTYGTELSLLYNGQVLSSLSKLYKVTNDKKYYDLARGIAELFAGKYEKERGYIEDEYREKNPISNSWVVMSLIDFYTASPNERYKKIIFELSEKILANQKNGEDDLLYYGGWGGAYSSSGTGWISEVMAETYRFCKKERGEDCDKYKEGVIKAIRWLIQNTYSEENTFFLKNPEKAIGGVFWNKLDKYVRTDSVCHSLNAYIRIIDDLGEGSLLSVPEKPLEEILEKLRD